MAVGARHDTAGCFGFEKYCLWQLDRRPPRYANPGLEIDGRRVDYSNGEYGPQIINDYACKFIGENREQPFLLYYPMVLTHAPYQPTPDSAGWNPAAKGESERGERYFSDNVSYADKMIGNVVDALERNHIRDRTLLVVLGDNGTGRTVTSRMGSKSVKGGKGARPIAACACR